VKAPTHLRWNAVLLVEASAGAAATVGPAALCQRHRGCCEGSVPSSAGSPGAYVAFRGRRGPVSFCASEGSAKQYFCPRGFSVADITGYFLQTNTQPSLISAQFA